MAGSVSDHIGRVALTDFAMIFVFKWKLWLPILSVWTENWPGHDIVRLRGKSYNPTLQHQRAKRTFREMILPAKTSQLRSRNNSTNRYNIVDAGSRKLKVWKLGAVSLIYCIWSISMTDVINVYCKYETWKAIDANSVNAIYGLWQMFLFIVFGQSSDRKLQ